jgi:hypothetical protein
LALTSHYMLFYLGLRSSVGGLLMNSNTILK